MHHGKVLMKKAAFALALLLLLTGLALAMFQARRVVQPAEILAGLTGIEGVVAQLNTESGAIPALRQARVALEAAIAESNSKGPTQGGASGQVLRNAAASLAVAESAVIQQSTR